MTQSETTRRLAADLLERAAKRVMWGWTQGTWARAATGIPCDPGDAHAREWCAAGAVQRELDFVLGLSEDMHVRDTARVALCAEAATFCSELPDAPYLWKDIGKWNDAPTQTQKNVSDTMLRAAKALRSDGTAPSTTSPKSPLKGDPVAY